jgi:hypothetical protein
LASHRVGLLGESILVDGHPDFVRPSIVARMGETPANLDEISATDCPNTGKSCSWLGEMAVLELQDGIAQPFSEIEMRKMQLAMKGFRCLIPKHGDETASSECDATSMSRQLEVSVQIVHERHSTTLAE